MQDPSNLEFLQICRLVLKGEESESTLEQAIQLTRKNLDEIKNQFLSQVSSKHNAEAQSVLNSIQAYADGVEVVDSYLVKNDKIVLSKGMEKVRQAIEEMQKTFHRYQVAVLAIHGPTNIPGYNFLANAIEEYHEKKISKDDLIALIDAAYNSVEKTTQKYSKHLNLPEVQKLKEGHDKHQDAILALKNSLLKEEPTEEALKRFEAAWKIIQTTQAPAQVKILTEKPTPSQTANFIINVSQELISGEINPSYFQEAFKHLMKEYSVLTQQLDQLEKKTTTSPLKIETFHQRIREGREALQLYLQAIDRYKAFQETSELKHLPQASLMLQKAVLQLFDIFKDLRIIRTNH